MKIKIKKHTSYTEKPIVETYAGIFEGLSAKSKISLIESFAKSLKAKEKSKEHSFYKSFGAFASNQSPEEIIDDIKSSRKFRKKKFKF